MIVNTPNGKREFPDGMSMDDIKGVLRKKYGFTPPPPSDVPLFSFTGKDKAGEWLQTAIRSGTFNLADPVASVIDRVTGGPDLATLRAQAKAEREDLGGWGALSADVAGRLANPLSRVGAGSIPGLIASGAVQSGVSALGAGDDLKTAAEAAATGAAIGGVTGGVGKYVATPSFVSHAVRRYLPIGAGMTAGYFGGGPVVSGLAGDAVRRALPEAPKFVPNANPWLNPWINSGFQGALSGRLAATAPDDQSR